MASRPNTAPVANSRPATSQSPATNVEEVPSSMLPPLDTTAGQFDPQSLSGMASPPLPATAMHPFLKSKFQIGSCKGPRNFPFTETVFHPDDVPADRRANKMAVKAFLKPHRVGQPALWDARTTGALEIFNTRSRINSEFDRSGMYEYNYRAEVLPPKQPGHIFKAHRFRVDVMADEEKAMIKTMHATDPVYRGQFKRTEEMPVNPKLEGKLKWQQSTIAVPAEIRRSMASLEDKRKTNSVKKNSTLKEYVSVEKKEAVRRAELRALKESGADITKFIQTGQLEDAPLLTTHNRLAKEPSMKYRVYQHSGKWAFNEAEGKEMWSDTGSFIKDSPGDIVKVVNPHGFNFASPTTSRGENLGYSVFNIKSTTGL